MIIFPKAKINLGLRITGNRPDGYHDIETIFYPIDLCDALEFVQAGENANEDILIITGRRNCGKPEENLVIRSLRKLREYFSVPTLKIHLHKAIPTGAGLGGGSSDAASTIKVINKHFSLSLSSEEMKIIALGLGSDCPFFIDCDPVVATGRGEIMQPIGPILAGYYVVLVYPGIGISTQEAYEKCFPGTPEKKFLQLINYPITQWKDLIINDFENSIFKKYPEIGAIKQTLYDTGALYSSMSGSGSTVYGIFKGKPAVTDEIKGLVIYEGLL